MEERGTFGIRLFKSKKSKSNSLDNSNERMKLDRMQIRMRYRKIMLERRTSEEKLDG